MISSIVSWAQENNMHLLIVVSITFFVLLYFFYKISGRSSNANRSVSVGGVNNGFINTGDINTNGKSSFLAILSNIATIAACFIGLIGVYISYLGLLKP